jgi:molybdopterin/thiamine biosynthesis adenylyltransferase
MQTNVGEYDRFYHIFDPRQFHKSIAVIGAGATGSNLIDCLVKMGVSPRLITVWDGDVVELHNLPNTTYTILDLEKSKSQQLDRVYGVKGRTWFTKKDELAGYDYVFACPDDMDVRKLVRRKIVCPPSWLIDLRVSAYLAQVFTYQDMGQYKETLFPNEEAEPDICGERMFRPTVLATVALAVNQLVKLEKGEEPAPILCLGMKTPVLTVT